MDEQEFVQLLESVLAPDTERVKAATATLRKKFYSEPASLLLLLKIVTSHDSGPVRQLAAVEARTLVAKHWESVPAEQKQRIRTALLQASLSEQIALVRHSAARVISAIAKIDLDDGEWTELPGILQAAATSADAAQREVGVYILFTLLEILGDGFVEKLADLFTLFSKTIRDPDSAQVRVNTMLALSKIAMLLDPDEDPPSLAAFQALFPHMVAVLKGAIDASDEDRTTQAFEVFQSLLGCDSQLMAAHFKDLIHFMVEVAASRNLSDDARAQALSFLMQTVKYRKMKVQALRVGEQLTLKCLEIATELDELKNEDEDVTPAATALGLLDTMAQSLPPSQVVVPLLHALPPYVNSPEPDRRRAGLLALGMCVEGAPDFIATQLKEIFPVVFRLLQDPEIRVRQAALHAVARLADDIADDVGKEHAKLVPALVTNLDSATDQVQSKIDGERQLDIIKASCGAIDSVFEGIEQTDAAMYIAELAPRLRRLFDHPDFKVKAAAVSALGTVALASKEAFMPYFEDTMHAISGYLTMKESEEELDLRGHVCDALSSMSQAVGAVAFQPFVGPLMQATEEAIHLDHPRVRETSYILWSTLSKVYRQEFTPYLDGVVKGLTQCLQQEESELEVELGEEAQDLLGSEIVVAGKKIKVSSARDGPATLSQAEDEADGNDVEIVDLDDDDDDDAWDELTGVSAVALEKEIALEVLGDLLSHCGDKFLPYYEPTVAQAMGFVDHAFEGLRKAAIGVLWRAYATLWSVCEEGGQMEKWKPGLPLHVPPTADLTKLGHVAMTATLALWKDEVDSGTVVDINRNVSAALKMCGPAILNDEGVVNQISELVISLIRKQHPCQQDVGDDEDLEGLDESSEYDWLVIETAMDVIVGMATALGPTFGELWKKFEKLLLKIAGNSEAMERSTSVGVTAEIVVAMKEGVTPYTTSLLKIFLHRLSDEDAETKSNAAYATGVLCEQSTATAEITKAYPTILTKLEPMLHVTDQARMMDNSMGCVSRMIVAHPDAVPLADVLPVVAGLLPLREDWEENDAVWGMIVTLYQSNSPAMRSQTATLLPKIKHVLFAPPKEQLSDETREKVVELAKYLFVHQPDLVRQAGDGLVEALGLE
ncbi:MAG: hypothetical protein M1838_000689 [Thelocarpon superellum]|nr:MAG: hypothetical protein M1838_000689 [Thelocarpon superellum]